MNTGEDEEKQKTDEGQESVIPFYRISACGRQTIRIGQRRQRSRRPSDDASIQSDANGAHMSQHIVQFDWVINILD